MQTKVVAGVELEKWGGHVHANFAILQRVQLSPVCESLAWMRSLARDLRCENLSAKEQQVRCLPAADANRSPSLSCHLPLPPLEEIVSFHFFEVPKLSDWKTHWMNEYFLRSRMKTIDGECALALAYGT